MSKKGIEALLAAAAADPAILQRFADVSTATDAVAVAAELGYDVTVEEVEAAATAQSETDLSDGELETISGGAYTSGGEFLCSSVRCNTYQGQCR